MPIGNRLEIGDMVGSSKVYILKKVLKLNAHCIYLLIKIKAIIEKAM